MPNARVLRDIKARYGVRANEVLRRAYLYVARNETLPPQVRFQAQLQLNTFGKYTRPTTVQNRCTATGRGRGIISEFGLCRVRSLSWLFIPDSSVPSFSLFVCEHVCGGSDLPCPGSANYGGKANAMLVLQYQFRLKALAKELPGVQKASW